MEGIVILIVLLLYMLPTIIACNRSHNDAGAICALNILVGWTFLGWGAAFVWSLTGNVRRDPVPAADPFAGLKWEHMADVPRDVPPARVKLLPDRWTRRQSW